MIRTVPSASVRVSADFTLSHLCPFADERDDGRVVIAWSAGPTTGELHSLGEYLDGWVNREISHEYLTHAIAADLTAAGLRNVRVTTYWRTAGAIVKVTGGDGAVLREPVDADGA